MLTLLLCSGLHTQLLEKWILSEKEWEREKAMALHLHFMQIYVQSIGVCVSPGTASPYPPPPSHGLPLYAVSVENLLTLFRGWSTSQIKTHPRSPLGRGSSDVQAWALGWVMEQRMRS